MARPRTVHVRYRRYAPRTPAGRRRIIRAANKLLRDKAVRDSPQWVACIRAHIAALRAVDRQEAK